MHTSKRISKSDFSLQRSGHRIITHNASNFRVLSIGALYEDKKVTHDLLSLIRECWTANAQEAMASQSRGCSATHNLLASLPAPPF